MIATPEHRRQPEPGARDRPTGPVVACIADRTSGRAVARIADSLARRLGARVLLTTVQQPTPEIASSNDMSRVLMRRGRSLLTSAARKLEQPTDLRVTRGEPSERLLAIAEREGAQLVVVSAPGETRLLGNVYLALASTARCPVVVVPPGVSTIQADGPTVCAVEDSTPSQAAADVAAEVARRLESHLLLVHAAGLNGDDDAAKILRRTAERLGDRVSARLLVDCGPSAEEIVAVAAREGAQLLVAASRGAGRVSSTLLGPVASQLARSAASPVMVVPGGSLARSSTRPSGSLPRRTDVSS